MANEYNELTLVKKHLGETSGANDELLDVVNEAVSRTIDSTCGRPPGGFLPSGSATARTFRASESWVLDVHDFWETAALIVKSDDNADGTFETTWAAGDFQVEPLNAVALGRPYSQLVALDVRLWPYLGPRARVQVTAKWGWPAKPAQVAEAHLIQCNRIWKRKEAVFGVAGSPELGEIRMLASRLDPDVAVLLEDFMPASTRMPGTTRVR